MIVWVRTVVGGENSAYNILVEFQAKGQVDLLSDTWTAVSRVAPFHHKDRINDFFG